MLLPRCIYKGLIALALFPGIASANSETPNPTKYLVVGGGYKAYGSQVALETNMSLAHSLMDSFGVDVNNAAYLFAAGNDQDIPDVAIQDDTFYTIENELFDSLFNINASGECKLRHNQIPYLTDSSTDVNLLDYLDLQTSHGAPFRFYFTGHGSPNPDENPANTGDKKEKTYENNLMNLWKGEVSVSDFVKILDDNDDKDNGEFQTVMVQCYSGGFANMNYVGGKKKDGLSPANRCGFFSQVASRPASGCSADVNFREEYSPYFFSAYAKKDEKQNPVDADFNKDGIISSTEAHAQVLIHENSTDVPTTTSSQLLRDFAEAYVKSSHTELDRQNWNVLAKSMSETEKAVVIGLGKILGYDITQQTTPLRFVQDKKEQMQKIADAASATAKGTKTVQYQIYAELRRDIQTRYPIFDGIVFGAAYSCGVVAKETVDAAKAMMLAHPLFAEFKAAYLQRKAASDKARDWERLVVKWERLEYLLMTKIYEQLLFQSNKNDWKNKYQQLQKCEAQPFFPESLAKTPPAPPTANGASNEPVQSAPATPMDPDKQD